MAKSLLEPRSLIPYFHLKGRDDREFDILSLSRKKNVVIFILTRLPQEFLVSVEEAYRDIKEENAEVLVICPLSPKDIENIHRCNRLTFWILSDENKDVSARFIEAKPDEAIAALFITDRYGEIYFQDIFSDVAQFPPTADIVKSLVFIESQCPECGEGL